MNEFTVLVEALKKKHLSIASCESLTAGLFAASIAEISGASSVLKGALVTYQNDIKERIAHVDEHLIDTYGVVSRECASAMAENTRRIMEADICVSFTGNAGPTAMEGKPAGLVYCAIAGPHGVALHEFCLSMERNALRREIVHQMCCELLAYIQ